MKQLHGFKYLVKKILLSDWITSKRERKVVNEICMYTHHLSDIQNAERQKGLEEKHNHVWERMGHRIDISGSKTGHEADVVGKSSNISEVLGKFLKIQTADVVLGMLWAFKIAQRFKEVLCRKKWKCSWYQNPNDPIEKSVCVCVYCEENKLCCIVCKIWINIQDHLNHPQVFSLIFKTSGIIENTHYGIVYLEMWIILSILINSFWLFFYIFYIYSTSLIYFFINKNNKHVYVKLGNIKKYNCPNTAKPNGFK